MHSFDGDTVWVRASGTGRSKRIACTDQKTTMNIFQLNALYLKLVLVGFDSERHPTTRRAEAAAAAETLRWHLGLVEVWPWQCQ